MKLTEIHTPYRSNGLAATYRNEYGHRVEVDYDHFATDPRREEWTGPAHLLPTLYAQDPWEGAKNSHPLIELYHDIDRDPMGTIYNGYDIDVETATRLEAAYDSPNVPYVDFANLVWQEVHPGSPEKLHRVSVPSNDQSTGYYHLLVVSGPKFPELDDTVRDVVGYLDGEVYAVTCDCGEGMGDLHGYGHDTEAAARDFIREMCNFEPEDHMTVGALKEALKDLDDCAAVTVNGQPLNVRRLDIDTGEQTVDITDY